MVRARAAVLALLVASCARPAVVAPPRVVTPAAVSGAPLVASSEAAASSKEAPADETDPADAGEWVTPCLASSPEHKAASDALDKLSQDIGALPMNGDPGPLGERLEKLVEDTCFAGVGSAGELGKGTVFTSAVSLKSYWRDGGESALTYRLGWARAKDRYYWLGPSIRTALTTDRTPKTHPLFPLLCPGSLVTTPAPGACGSETAGWQQRASTALLAHARAERASHLESRAEDDQPFIPKTPGRCSKLATAAPAERAFLTFSDCMQETPQHRDALPLGFFRAPTSGWLVLRGRRGHHSWCNELRAYDLATGSAYVASLCGGMFSSASPAITVERGRLPIDALREAAWMMFLAGVADHDVLTSGEGRAIPDAISIRVPKDHSFGFGIGSMGWSSGRSTLVYQWVRQGKSAATGTVEWPDAHHGADLHATNLLAIAEAGFVKGCSGVASLPAIPWAARNDKTTRVGDPEHYFPDYSGGDFDVLERALEQHARGPCVP